MTNPATEEPDLIPASGEGANFFDAPALFFMTHEETIRRWADLSGRARQCQADYLRSLSTVIEDLGRGHGLDLIEADQNGWHHLYLIDAATPTKAGPSTKTSSSTVDSYERAVASSFWLRLK